MNATRADIWRAYRDRCIELGWLAAQIDASEELREKFSAKYRMLKYVRARGIPVLP